MVTECCSWSFISCTILQSVRDTVAILDRRENLAILTSDYDIVMESTRSLKVEKSSKMW